MKFRIYSFGCKVNQYESEYIRKLMLADGYDSALCDDDADIFIVNSCSVTAVSDAKCRRFLTRLRRNFPTSIIVLCGCMSQAFPDREENFISCDIVTGNTSRSMIPKYIKRFANSGERIIDIKSHDRENETFEFSSIDTFSERTRAYLKIEDGCDCFCSYCIIPYARGKIRSKNIDDIKNEVRLLADNGYSEIVLVGINLSKYGTDIGCDLYDAVSAVAGVEKIRRIRLGSLEPELLTEELVAKLSAINILCPHFHLSLQSGCDETLSRMNRHYTSEEYMQIVSRLKRHFQNPSFTTDVMVGFPGEDEDEFKKSLEFVKKARFAKVHVFPYSRRSGTVADTMKMQLTKAQKDERAAAMSKIADENRLAFLSSQLGLECEVLFEKKLVNGYYEGYTENYTPVLAKSETDISHKCFTVKLLSIKDRICIGELI